MGRFTYLVFRILLFAPPTFCEVNIADYRRAFIVVSGTEPLFHWKLVYILNFHSWISYDFHWKIGIPFRFLIPLLHCKIQMTVKGSYLRTAKKPYRAKIASKVCFSVFCRAQSRNGSIDLPPPFYTYTKRIANNRTTNRSRLCKVRDFSAFTSGDMQNRREPFVPVAVR